MKHGKKQVQFLMYIFFNRHNKKSLPTLVDHMEKGLTEISIHFTSWKIKLNSLKTEAILFSKSSRMRHNRDSNKIKFDGKVLDWQKSVKYLGVILDEKLLMRQNIETNISKARKAQSHSNQKSPFIDHTSDRS